MKKFWLVIVILLFSHGLLLSAQNPTPLQIFFAIKKIFPEIGEISVFISKTDFEKQKIKIGRAAAQSQLRAKLFPIGNSADIGRNLKQLGDSSILVIFDSDIFRQNKNKIYILSKCKEKKIKLVTSSKEYSDSGALIGILAGNDGKTHIVLNLKHRPDLQPVFTDARIQQTGIAEIIQ